MGVQQGPPSPCFSLVSLPCPIPFLASFAGLLGVWCHSTPCCPRTALHPACSNLPVFYDRIAVSGSCFLRDTAPRRPDWCCGAAHPARDCGPPGFEGQGLGSPPVHPPLWLDKQDAGAPKTPTMLDAPLNPPSSSASLQHLEQSDTERVSVCRDGFPFGVRAGGEQPW